MKKPVSRRGRSKRLIVGISGATGAVFGIRLLQAIAAEPGWEAHLVLTDAGVLNAHQELGMTRKAVEGLAEASAFFLSLATSG